MPDLIATISKEGKEIKLVGNKLIYKLHYLADGDPIFAAGAEKGIKDQKFLFLYERDNSGFSVESDSSDRRGEYNLSFTPKAFAKINFGKTFSDDESIISLEMEMNKGLFGFKGYGKIKNLLEDSFSSEAEIIGIKELDKKVLATPVLCKIYPGRPSALFGLITVWNDFLLNGNEANNNPNP